MWVGSFTCGIPAFEFELFCSKMAQYKATWAHIVPPIAVELANSQTVLKYDLSHLKTILIAAAPTKRALQIKLKTRFGQDTRIIQGMTDPAIWSLFPKSIASFPTIVIELSRFRHVRVLADRHVTESTGRRKKHWIGRESCCWNVCCPLSFKKPPLSRISS